mgnify:CR=1 FL=1
MFKYFFVFLYLFCFGFSVGQQIGIGDWEMHLNYSHINTVVQNGSTIYVGTQSGLYTYDSADNSITTFSKMDDLSDLNISALNYDSGSGSIIIGYNNGNLDVLKSGGVLNMPEIINSNVLAPKTINSIFINEGLAYLSCPFGLVVFDISRHEIKETYYFSNNGTFTEVFDCHIFDQEFHYPQDEFLANKIFVGTSEGLFYANRGANLLDFEVWSKDSRLLVYSDCKQSPGSETLISSSEQEVHTVIGYDLKESGGKRLTVGTRINYAEIGLAWMDNCKYNFFQFNVSAYTESFSPKLNTFRVNGDVPGELISMTYNENNNTAVVVTNDNYTEKSILLEGCGESCFDVNWLENSFSINTESLFSETEISSPSIVSAITYNNPVSNDVLFFADEKNGLFKASRTNDSVSGLNKIDPNGPVGIGTGSIGVSGSKLMLSHGAKNSSWNNLYNRQELSVYQNGTWTKSENLIESGIYDAIEVCGNNNQSGQFFVGTWNGGLIELQNDSLVQIYNETNSSLQSITVDGWIRVGGVDIDKDGVIWVTNSESERPLSRFDNGNWNSYVVPNLNTNEMSGRVLCLQNDQKWIQIRNGGIIAVKHEKKGLVSKKIGTQQGLPSLTVNCFTEDKDGFVWVGTSQGLSVFYNTNSVFDNNFGGGEYILIETEDGYVERLFENTDIQDIAVDGGNRKWVATKKNGVFLISDDGTEQIKHFTKENSPLIDNYVSDIEIISASGEVFFNTNKGLCSYRSGSSEQESYFKNVTIFPNPVRQDYEGPIAISGLTDETSVKITDISGNIVYEIESVGGTATWDGKKFNGERVATGVYLFFCTNATFDESVIKKILIYN